MDILELVNVVGGLAFFLFGMHVMSNGLKEAAGGKMEGRARLTEFPETCRRLASCAAKPLQIRQLGSVVLHQSDIGGVYFDLTIDEFNELGYECLQVCPKEHKKRYQILLRGFNKQSVH